ncbi:hemolysin III family protein [Frankia sp. CNm7]|uniref:Hemolysin III family protein n=1 Tax=Frankia nepalensis TaxID=1836974 RepID=A0A937USS3_9ACTN|nr:hemolysin III family protein [Frankia nepalensis]MBL7498598.1 hemolysin III family protein [Frankia nepalensis]MBL7510467.1 hemolysin III family protein [Frankia nepalensis]MBL7517193.1 hemolysin III family protein [Frankia nepalensis]MBL7630525.1 hemolysin III family protein [Frankia nepalensis]
MVTQAATHPTAPDPADKPDDDRAARGTHPRDIVRPRMRGWLHAGAFPVSLALGVVAVALPTTLGARLAVGVYAISITALFGTSALYHRTLWSTARARSVMKRLDHSMIFVFIAGTYTPFALLAMPSHIARPILAVVWGGAALGVVLRMLWLHSPRYLIIPLYIALGWVAVFVFPEVLHTAGVATLTLLVAGGVCYSAGAIVYALRRPDPAPRIFGYHEVFHAFTLVAACCHYIALMFAIYR